MPSTPCEPAATEIEADAETMRRLGGGDEAAYRQLLRAHLAPVTGLAHRLLDDAGEAEEIGQEAFLRLWRQAGKWRPEARIGTWLYRVTYNLCIDRLRRRREVTSESVPELADERAGVLALHQRDQRRRIVAAALARLPERQRAALHLVHFQEASNILAAEVLGVSVEALESLLARGRRRLRAELEELKSDLLGDP